MSNLHALSFPQIVPQQCFLYAVSLFLPAVATRRTTIRGSEPMFVAAFLFASRKHDRSLCTI